MCEFFSAIATRDGRLLFTEQDRHETIIQRAALKDDSRFLRWWVRVEQRPEEPGLRVDETSVPAWFEAGPWQDRMDTLLHRIAPAWAMYDERLTAAHVAYETCRTRVWTVYEVARAAASAASDETPAWTDLDRRLAPAVTAAQADLSWTSLHRSAVYHRACAEGLAAADSRRRTSGWTAYETACRQAWVTHAEACARAGAAYTEAIRCIDGYLPPPET